MANFGIFIFVGVVGTIVLSFANVIPSIPAVALMRSPVKLLHAIGWIILIGGRLYISLTLAAWATLFMRNQIAPTHGLLGTGFFWIVAFIVSTSLPWKELRIALRQYNDAIREGSVDEAWSNTILIQACNIIVPIVNLMFFIMAFFPTVSHWGWGWIPYVFHSQ